MKNKVTILMYHYVRDLKNSKYPQIKGLDLNLFKEQIEYILKYYKVITVQEIQEYYLFKKALPQNALLLTFDDAYLDHYINVFPILNEKGMQGSFFTPVKAIMNHEVLGVNKIHFVLAAVENKDLLVAEVFKYLDQYKEEYKLADKEIYYKKYAISNRFDSPEVIFIKRILQVALPEKLRKIIIDNLFKKYLTEDESLFSQELYMSLDQIKCMSRNGMYIGVHGYDHYWLNDLIPKAQKKEIELSLEFLKLIGTSTDNWVISYPYGAYNETLIEILRENGCGLGFTTEVEIADLGKHNRLKLPRLDTNDLPKIKNTENFEI